MPEEALVNHIFVRLEPQIQNYVEVRNATTAQLLEVLAKFEERYSYKKIQGLKNSSNAERRGWNNSRWSSHDDKHEEFVKPWIFHVLADLEYPCILGVDFISGSKIVLDFDRKSLALPDSQIEKVVTKIEEGNVEIDLNKTGLEESQKKELQDLLNSFKN
ncbi:uncharacterized protein TNCV_4290391 [Trichonephila clavipes]|nr:uncharacterized protein TNCV_4290391 [Trichonephila clavipes]